MAGSFMAAHCHSSGARRHRTKMPDLPRNPIGERINRAWRAWVRDHIDGAALRAVLREIDWDETGESNLYFYVVIGMRHAEPVIQEFDGPMVPDYFQGASASKLVVAIPVWEGMTKHDLM